MHEAQQFAGLQPVELAAQLRQIAQGREIGEIQLEAAEQLVHRVVAADDHFDGRETRGSLPAGRRSDRRARGWRGLGFGELRLQLGSRGTLARAPTMSEQADLQDRRCGSRDPGLRT